MTTAPFSLKEKILQRASSDTHQFAEYIEEMKIAMRDDDEDKDEDYYNLNEKDLVGDPTTVAFFMNEINKYISQHPYQGEIPAIMKLSMKPQQVLQGIHFYTKTIHTTLLFIYMGRRLLRL